MKMQVLSIDAWGNKEDGYEWNNWHKVGFIDISDKDNDKQILEKMYVNGFINTFDEKYVYVDDDNYNYVICDYETDQPLLAIEYGSTI